MTESTFTTVGFFVKTIIEPEPWILSGLGLQRDIRLRIFKKVKERFESSLPNQSIR
jgi:hypothetical protein